MVFSSEFVARHRVAGVALGRRGRARKTRAVFQGNRDAGENFLRESGRQVRRLMKGYFLADTQDVWRMNSISGDLFWPQMPDDAPGELPNDVA